MNQDDSLSIKDTGERFLPWINSSNCYLSTLMHYEHLSRYFFATQFCTDKYVLDVASGEGYGTFMLSKCAKKVVGVDIDESAVNHAKSKYNVQNIDFILASATDIPIRDDHIFDVIVSFETIEHIHEQEKMLFEIKRLLKEDGIFVVSTPNKVVFSKASCENPFHVKELDFKDFEALLKVYFNNCLFFGQRYFPTTSIWSLDEDINLLKSEQIKNVDDVFIKADKDEKKPLYYIAIARNSKINFKINNFNLIDISDAIVTNLAKDIENREKLLDEFRDAISQKDNYINGLDFIIKDKDKYISDLGLVIKDKDRHISDLNDYLNQFKEHIKTLEDINNKLKEGNFDNFKAYVANTLSEIFNIHIDNSNVEEKFKDEMLYMRGYIHDLNIKCNELYQIKNSTSYRMYSKIYKISDKMLPQGSRRRRFTKRVLKLRHIFNPKYIKKGFVYLKKNGLRNTMTKVVDFTSPSKVDIDNIYDIWIKNHEPLDKELSNQRDHKFNISPLISIIVPTYNTPLEFLSDMIKSVEAQTYTNWELCIADGLSINKTEIEELLKENKKIKYVMLNKNLGIAQNSNAALSLATGDYIALLDHDDTLAPFALYEVVNSINNNPNADFIYSDEDKFEKLDGKRFEPHFKPDFSPDTLRSYNYICHLAVIKSDIIKKVGGFRDGYEGSQDHDLFLRVAKESNSIVHIPKVLYHWRCHPNSVAKDGTSKNYAFESGRKAIEDSLNMKASVFQGAFLGSYRVKYEIDDNPKVSIIIPNKNHYKILSTCINSILTKSSYKNYEIIIVENGSTDEEIFNYYEELKKYDNIKILNYEKEFNYSCVNNFGTDHSSGEYVVFLNNDIEIITHNWIEGMLENASRDEIGFVGVKLLYPNNIIQHSGVVIGLFGFAEHICNGIAEGKNESLYYCKYLTDTIRNVSAVTGACMMINKKKFYEIGRFDENFILCGSDVDICINAMKHGYLNIYTPFVKHYHHESYTRKDSKIPKIDIELSKISYKKYIEGGDPYYSINLDYNSKLPAISKN